MVQGQEPVACAPSTRPLINACVVLGLQGTSPLTRLGNTGHGTPHEKEETERSLQQLLSYSGALPSCSPSGNSRTVNKDGARYKPAVLQRMPAAVAVPLHLPTVSHQLLLPTFKPACVERGMPCCHQCLTSLLFDMHEVLPSWWC